MSIHKNRTYLIDTRSLTPAERVKALELLDFACFMRPKPLKNSHVYMAFTTWSADEFATIQLPKGCVVTDVTGHDLMAYR